MAYKYHYKKPSKAKMNYKIVLGLIILISVAILTISLNINPNVPIVPTPVCGDGACQSTENCSTCPTDCGQCPITQPPANGNLIVAVKDDPVRLIGGNTILNLNLTIKSIQVHKVETNETDENITASDWITIFNGTKVFDLLKFTDVTALIGEKELEPGKYTQIRLYISSAFVNVSSVINGFPFIRNYEATIPSKVLKLIHPFTIESGKTLVLTLDFDVENSITRPGGTWNFKPTIKTVGETTLEKNQMPENSIAIPEA